MPTVNVNQLAKAMNVAPRTAQRFVTEGMPRVARGRYDLVQCVLWYIRSMQATLAARGEGDGEQPTPLMAARIKQAAERTKAMRAARLEREGKLVEIAALRPDLRKVRSIILRGLGDLPARLRRKGL